MEWANFSGQTGSIFNSMGLIGDGLGNGEPAANLNVPRISYYAYKLLAAAMDTDQAGYAGKMPVHQEPDLYAYRFASLATNRPNRYILWRDSGTQSVTFAINTRRAGITNLITDALGNMRTAYVTNADSQGNLTIEVGLDPMLVEEIVDAPLVKGLALQSDKSLSLELESVAGRPCVVETTTNLSVWTPLLTSTPAVISWSLLDFGASNFPQRFYRARQLNE